MSTTEKIVLLRRRSFGEVVGDSFAFIRLNLAVILKVHFLISLPIIIVTAALFVLLFRDHFSLIRTLSSGVFVDSVAFRDDMSNFAVARLFSLFAMMPVSINTFLILDRYSKSETGVVTFEEVTALAWRKYLPLMISKLIMAPIIFFSGMFLILPGIAFFTLFMCVEMLIIQHNYGIFKAISRSSSIMSRFFWTPFLFNLVFLGVYLLFVALMQLPVVVLEQATDLTTEMIDPDSFWSIAAMSLRTFNTILGYVTYTIPTVAMGVLYFSLREKASQASIMERIRNIGLEKNTKNEFSLGDEQY
jgi:hypothetical protein